MKLIQALLGLIILVSCVESQYRRVIRTNSGPGFRRRVKKVKIIPNIERPQQPERDKTVQTEAASERLLNPFSLFNLVRFPNTACTTDRGESLPCNCYPRPPGLSLPPPLPQVLTESATQPPSAGDEAESQPDPALEDSEPAAPSSVSATRRLLRTGRSSPAPPPSPPSAA